MSENKKDANYYHKRTGTIIINQFKTSEQYDPIKYVLSKEMRKHINKSLRKEPREYLFGNNLRDTFNKTISKNNTNRLSFRILSS